MTALEGRSGRTLVAGALVAAVAVWLVVASRGGSEPAQRTSPESPGPAPKSSEAPSGPVRSDRSVFEPTKMGAAGVVSFLRDCIEGSAEKDPSLRGTDRLRLLCACSADAVRKNSEGAPRFDAEKHSPTSEQIDECGRFAVLSTETEPVSPFGRPGIANALAIDRKTTECRAEIADRSTAYQLAYCGCTLDAALSHEAWPAPNAEEERRCRELATAWAGGR